MTYRGDADLSGYGIEETSLADAIVDQCKLWYDYVPPNTAYEAAKSAIEVLRSDRSVLINDKDWKPT